MAQDKSKKSETKSQAKNDDRKKSAEKKRDKKKDDVLTKIVIRRLPPSWTEETVLEQLSPIPDHDYFHFARADHSLGQHAFSRAYINFLNQDDVLVFKEKFDGYVFLDAKGNEFPAIVEFAPFLKKPKRTQRKADPRCGTIEQDPDYQKFLDSLNNPVIEPAAAPEVILEEIEAREKELKVSHGVPKLSTPLLDYIKKKKEDKKAAILKAREERKKREIERRKQREEEKRKQREREREKQLEKKRRQRLDQQEKDSDKTGEMHMPAKLVLLKNPEREKEQGESGSADSGGRLKSKDVSKAASVNESPGKEAKGETRGKGETGARNRDYSGRSKFTEANSRQRERDGKTRYKPSPRETKWKERDQEHEHIKEPDRDREHNRYRDTAKSGGSRRTPDPERTKSRPGKFERDDAKNRELSADKNSDRSSALSKESSTRERPQSYQKRREEYHERKAAKNIVGRGERVDKAKADTGDETHDTDNRLEDTHLKSLSNECDHTKREGADLKLDVAKPGAEVDQEKSAASSPHVENAGDSEKRDDSAKDAKGRKVRYRDRPERAIYNPAQRAAQRRKEMEARSRSKDSPESSQSPEGHDEHE